MAPRTPRIDSLARAVGGARTRRSLVAAAALALAGRGAAHAAEADRAPGADKKKKRCKKAQMPCSSKSQCCQGRDCAFNGLGIVCCSQAGQPCAADFDCCGALLCNFVFGVCA